MKTTKLFGKLFMLACILCCASCNDDESIEPKKYELQSVQWKFEEGDEQEVIKKVLPEEVVQNNSDKSIYYITKDSSYTFSQFFCDDPVLLSQLTGDSINVCIPSPDLSLNSEYTTIYNNVTSPITNKKITLTVNRWYTEETEIGPHTQLTCNRTIYRTKLKATYRLRFIEKTTYETLDIVGKWEGEFENKSEYTFSFKTIE